MQLVFALGSFLLLLLSIERPQRKRRGFVCFYPLRYIYRHTQSDFSEVHGTAVEGTQIPLLAPSTFYA